MRALLALLLLLALGGCILLVDPDQSCQSDSDCYTGYVCQVDAGFCSKAKPKSTSGGSGG